jgi:hypothetical protein
MSEPTNAYRCYWKSGPFNGRREIAAQSFDGAAETCQCEVIAEFPTLDPTSIKVWKLELM